MYNINTTSEGYLDSFVKTLSYQSRCRLYLEYTSTGTPYYVYIDNI
jgi:hypothetical protein